MKLFNTKTRRQEELIPLKDKKITLYTCGPTVYNYAHIGNFRTYIFEDLLRRTLKYLGYELTHVMNITDVDDKTIQGAIQQEKNLREFTEPFTKAFFEDLDTLGIERAEHYPKATDFIPQMIEIIQSLEKKGIAYKGQDGSIYFSIAKFPNYGCLSHFKLNELKTEGSGRVHADEYDKEHASDFVLWKAHDPERDGEIAWDSPFGRGRPGWHIECSTMAMKLLGETIDIHVGGVDNMFPHHENEIAQSESFSGKSFVTYWLHVEHLLVDNKKMSKSLGNFYTLRDILKMGYTGLEVRLMLLSAHYRTQLNFTLKSLDAASATIVRLSDFIDRLRKNHIDNGDDAHAIIETTRKDFTQALEDDLNIAEALAALFEMVRHVNQLADQNKLSKAGADAILKFLEEMNCVLGIIPFHQKPLDVPFELIEALKEREIARKEKNWAEADKQRDLIASRGYVIEDTSEGPRLKKKRK